MSIEIPGVPETITRADYTRLIESVGLSAKTLTNLRWAPEGIYAKVQVRDAEGRLIVIEGNQVAQHEVFIRVVDDE